MEYEVIRRKRKRYKLTRRTAAFAAGALLLCLAVVLLLSIKPKPEFRALTYEEIQAVLASNGELPEDVEKVISSGLSLVGKVNYFWGGKSSVVGWDDRWGEITEVTSKGSPSTGKLCPFGLDCSGFVTWCFIQMGYSPKQADEIIGNGTWNQWDKSEEIRWSELRPGDFAFQNRYPTNKGNHIGIYIGFDDTGAPVFMHCSAQYDSVVVTPAGDVFRYARRPRPFQQP